MTESVHAKPVEDALKSGAESTTTGTEAPVGSTEAPVGSEDAAGKDWESLLKDDDEAAVVDELPEKAEAVNAPPKSAPEKTPEPASAASKVESPQPTPVAPKATTAGEVPKAPEPPKAAGNEGAQGLPPVATPVAVPPHTPMAEAPVMSQPEATARPQHAPVAKTPEQMQAEREQWRKDAAGKLVQYFGSQLSAEDVEALRLEPEKVLPKLLANTYLDVYDALVENMTVRMPNVITGMQEQQRRAQAAEQAFYSQWPQLQKPEYREVVERTVKAYHQANPGVPLERIIKEAGAMAVVTLQLPLPGMPNGAVPPTAPAAPSAGYTPAAPGAGSQPKPDKPANKFTQLAEELLVDDT